MNRPLPPTQPPNEPQLFPFGEVDPNAAQLLADQVRAIVVGDMRIDSTQIGRDQRREGAVILRGVLLKPSEEVFPRWLEELRRLECTPMLRRDPEGGKEDVILRVMSGVVKPPAGKPWINLLLFAFVVLSTLLVGVGYADLDLQSNLDYLRPSTLIQGWPFSATLLSILLAHEFGHYFAARYHRMDVSLPFFIPLPIPAINDFGFILGFFPPGTMGAFIRLKALIPDRRKLFDVGVSGPLAGFIVAVPLLFFGLFTSEVKNLPVNDAFSLEGNSILYLLAKFLVHGRLLPDFNAGVDVFLNAVAHASWFGLLVTAINLLPVGQLDGGHTVFALFGERARRLNQTVLGILFVLAIVSVTPLPTMFPILQNIVYTGWFLWLGLIFFVVGPYHPPALDDVTELDPRRRWIGYLVILIFIITFVPVPERIIGL